MKFGSEAPSNDMEGYSSHLGSFFRHIQIVTFVALAGALVLAVAACDSIAPKAPTRSEFLHVGNEFMVLMDAVRSRIESNEEFRQIKVTYSTNGDSETESDHRGYTFGFRVHEFEGDANSEPDAQIMESQLTSFIASYEENLNSINKSINALEEKCNNGNKQGLPQLEAIISFRENCNIFADYALYPIPGLKMSDYKTNYIIYRHRLKYNYGILVNKLKSSKVKESSSALADWAEELRVATDKMALYEQQEI